MSTAYRHPWRVWWFPYKYKRRPDDISNLKLLFSQVVSDSVQEAQFGRALETYGVGNAKLTEGLFYVDPEKYLPVNKQTIPYLKARNIDHEFGTYEQYLQILQKLSAVSDQPFYEISHEAFMENQIEKTQRQSDKSTAECNYWVFQGNPKHYRIIDALKADSIKTWRVSAHKDKIKIGDKLILWVTGNQSGCYALAEVASEIFNATDDETERFFQTETSGTKSLDRVKLKILVNLWDSPVRKDQIADLPEFADFKGGNQGTTFGSTEQEYKAIERLAEGTTVQEPNAPYVPNTAHSKNIILYGPPGTGKTYTTIDLAVGIIDGRKNDDHQLNKKRFDELLRDQIEFVTFHQNYTYEDFVLGIKPDLEGSDSALRFSRHEGVFYRLSQRARTNYLASRHDSTVARLRPFEEVFDEFARPLENGQEIEVNMISGISFHLTELGNRSLDFRKKSGNSVHSLTISRLKQIYEGSGEVTSGLAAYYKPLAKLLVEKGTSNSTNRAPLKNYVLVIDEINRANMSRVFGELITLLEEDKRLGAANHIQLLLPSGERFSVPPNLYIIGTMNTADKSLALLDIALRRRFEFVGMYPKYDLPEMDPSAAEILQNLNKAIYENKKSADFLIGHAYFLNQKKGQLKETFEKRVIPLLMEYFSGRTEVVRKVLQQAGVQTYLCDSTYQLKLDDDAL